MLLLSLRPRSFPAWLGIFAVLTIFIAPALSQMLAHRDHGNARPQALNAATTSTGHHHHAGYDMAGAHDRSPPQPSLMANHEACGYCVLFFYTPALSDIAGIVITVKRYLSPLRIAAAQSSVILIERFASPIPRAPPL
ncbi:DUF2946 domain-containing protein [Brenneria sp. g21c3]|uniref:DUF2946 domain-containing protein n=1 Tax=Brenneria sp. g21c3 TaxID=3093893 RepID=UPI002EB0792B|nr:DUF2946 domain-containing protein [Brenneria sp. g21c3]